MRKYSSNFSYLDVINDIENESKDTANFRKNKKNPSPEQTEEIVNLRTPRRLAGIGSIVSSYNGFNFGDDTTAFDTQELRDTFLRNPIAYRYCVDLPRESLHNNWKIISRDEQQPDNEGLRAIQYWRGLFEASPTQMNLDELIVFADQYYRLYGEIALELRFVRSPLLTLMGFANGEMLKYIDLISPMLIPQADGVMYNNDGDITGYSVYDSSGTLTLIDSPEEVSRIVYFHNQPPNENRGISRLRPLMSLLDGHDDLRELEIMMMEALAMPVEFLQIDEDGLTAVQAGKIRDDLETELSDMMEEHRRVLIANKRVGFNLIGAEGKNLDIHVFSDKLKADVYQGLGIPLPFIEAEGSTKSTVEVQNYHYIKSQLVAQDQSFGRKLLEQYIFPIILREMNVDMRLMPMMYFPQPYSSYDSMEQSIADRNYMETVGEPARRHVMEREGFVKQDGDGMPDLSAKPQPSPSNRNQQSWGYTNGLGDTHEVVDTTLDRSELIARRK